VSAETVLAVLAAFVASYLLGAIPSGLLVGRLMRGVDVRRHGSGSTGATNVLRTIGWRGAAVVTIMDVGKGALAMLLGGYLAGVPGQVAAGVAVLAGHNWPVWGGFRGGRGVMPAMGASFVIVPVAAVAGTLIGVTVILASRYVSLGSLMGTVVCCGTIAAYAFMGWSPLVFAPLALAGGGMIVLRHRGNIARLLQGTERRLGERAAS
jgi:glycerol-3-phosphate acyltransferase PlsY